MVSDTELFRAWRAGDRNAGSLLFERHFDSLHRFFRNKLDAGVEDLVQRTFVACVEGKDSFREEGSFRSYLFGVARNLLREHFRRERRAGERVDLEQAAVVDLGPSPVALLAGRAEERLLLQALRQIPVASQMILELYFWEQMTGREVGLVLGVPEDTARSRLRKAKQLLAAALRRLEAGPAEPGSTLSHLRGWAAALRGGLGHPQGSPAPGA